MPVKENFANLKSPAALAWLGIPFVLGLVIDLWTKHLAVLRFAPVDASQHPGEHQFIPGWLHFTFVSNYGAALGMGQGKRWIFVIVSLAAIVAVIMMFGGSGKRRFYQVLLGMLLAGIIGNLYDRLAYGYVRDMIHAVPRWPNFFPWVFNVADSLLCVSIGTLLVYGFLYPDKPDNEVSDQPA